MLPEHFNSLETSIAVSGFLSPEFVQVRRYQEGKQTIVKLMTGQYYATKFPETISTTPRLLHSCMRQGQNRQDREHESFFAT